MSRFLTKGGDDPQLVKNTGFMKYVQNAKLQAQKGKPQTQIQTQAKKSPTNVPNANLQRALAASTTNRNASLVAQKGQARTQAKANTQVKNVGFLRSSPLTVQNANQRQATTQAKKSHVQNASIQRVIAASRTNGNTSLTAQTKNAKNAGFLRSRPS